MRSQATCRSPYKSPHCAGWWISECVFTGLSLLLQLLVLSLWSTCREPGTGLEIRFTLFLVGETDRYRWNDGGVPKPGGSAGAPRGFPGQCLSQAAKRWFREGKASKASYQDWG